MCQATMTRAVFDRYSIKLHDQTRAVLKKTTEYVESLATEPKVLPLSTHHGVAGKCYGYTYGTHPGS